MICDCQAAKGRYPRRTFHTASSMDADLMCDNVWIRCPDCREFVKTPGEDQISTLLFAATCSHCGLEFDWRSTHCENFLRGAVFRWEEYLAPSQVWDHD